MFRYHHSFVNYYIFTAFDFIQVLLVPDTSTGFGYASTAV